jgi:hypothetical protein
MYHICFHQNLCAYSIIRPVSGQTWASFHHIHVWHVVRCKHHMWHQSSLWWLHRRLRSELLDYQLVESCLPFRTTSSLNIELLSYCFFFWGELPPKFVSSHLHHTMTLVQLCHSSLVMFNWHRRSPLVTCLCPWLSSRWRGEAVLLLNIRSSFSVNESFLVTYLHYFLSQSILYHFFSIYRSWLFFAIYQYSTRILSLTLCIEISKSLCCR